MGGKGGRRRMRGRKEGEKGVWRRRRKWEEKGGKEEGGGKGEEERERY